MPLPRNIELNPPAVIPEHVPPPDVLPERVLQDSESPHIDPVVPTADIVQDSSAPFMEFEFTSAVPPLNPP